MSTTTRPPLDETLPSDARDERGNTAPRGRLLGPLARYRVRLVAGPGEESVGKPPSPRLATPSGGTSGSEDTTRTAGYVADLSRARVAPPGPPVVQEPTLVAQPEGLTPPPVTKKPVAPTKR